MFVFWIAVVTLNITLCTLRVHQVLQVKLDGMVNLGSKVKEWVQTTHLADLICFQNGHSLYWKSRLSKGNDGAQGSQGPTGPPGSPGSPGLMVYACYISAWYLCLTHSSVSVNCMLYHLLFAMKGPPWYWGIGWKRWKTRAAGELNTCIPWLACPHTGWIYASTHWSNATVGIFWNMHIIVDLWCWLFFFSHYQGEAGPPGPAGPRGIPVSITFTSYMTCLFRFFIPVQKITWIKSENYTVYMLYTKC